MNRITIVLAVLVLALAIKRSNLGKNDWALKNIGEVSGVAFPKYDALFFTSERGVYGAISKQTGETLYRSEFSPSEQLVQQLDDSNQIYFRNNQNKIEHYRFQSQQTRSYLDLRTVPNEVNGELKDVKIIGGDCYLLTDKQLSYVQKKKWRELQQADYLAVGKIDKKAVRVYSNEEGMLCSKDFINGTIVEGRKCLNVSNPEAIHLTKSVQIFEYSDYVAVYNLDNTLKKRIQGSLKDIFDKSEHLLVSRGDSKYLIRLQDTSQQAIPANHFIVESTKGQLITIERTEQQNGSQLHILMPDFKNAFWRSNTEILHAWINQKSNVDLEVLVQYTDLKTQFFVITPKDKEVEERWSREESLAYVTHSLFVQYQNEKDLSNPYYQQLLQSHMQRSWNPVDIINQFRKRLQSEYADFKMGLTNLVWELLRIFDRIELGNLFAPNKPVFRYVDSDSYQTTYGLRKMLLLVTKFDTIISLDTKTGAVNWKVHLEKDRIPLGLFRFVADQVQRIILVEYNPTSSKVQIREINWNSGHQSLLKEYSYSAQPRVLQGNDNSLQITLNDRVDYFDLHEEFEQSHREFIFYRQQQNTIIGQTPGKVQWKVHIPAGQQVIRIETSYRNEHSKLPLFDDTKVYYKNIDFTNFAVLTSSQGNILGLYIINGLNGHILLNRYRKNVDFSNYINMAYDQNCVVVSYFSRMNKLFEIWVVEQFQEQTDTSAIGIINKYLSDNSTGPSPNRQRSHVLFEQQIFGSPLFIKKLAVSSSKLSLLKRNVVVITRSNDLYSIDRKLLSARRPSGTAVFQSDKLPKYDYLLPIFPTSFISHTQLCGIQTIQFNPTNFESNLLVLAHGIDVFVTRWTPQQTFDMITQDFNYLFLLGVVTFITVAFLFVKRITIRAKNRAMFRD